jgi:class 3 adenylate cyclase
MVEASGSYPLPQDPALAAVAAALNDAGHWCWVMDDRWRLVYVTDAIRITYGANVAPAYFPIGCHAFGPEALRASADWRFGPNTPERMRVVMAGLGGWLVADTPGGADALREIVDPALRDEVDRMAPADSEALWFVARPAGLTEEVDAPVVGLRIRHPDGRLAGTLMLIKPAANMAILGAIASMGDLRHFEQMQQVARAGRRPAAILFADLEGSSPLARRLSTASYFALGRRLVRACDRCVIEAGGLVGRHVGDGVAAFFLAESAGSESAAARACISAAQALRDAVGDIARRSELNEGDVVLRFGLHWGSKLYVGAVTTGGRAEVTALGDEVNEAARIEACATGGRALASKDLVERLDAEDAALLGLDPDHTTYTALSELTTATEKARRDAPAVAVCDV